MNQTPSIPVPVRNRTGKTLIQLQRTLDEATASHKAAEVLTRKQFVSEAERQAAYSSLLIAREHLMAAAEAMKAGRAEERRRWAEYDRAESILVETTRRKQNAEFMAEQQRQTHGGITDRMAEALAVTSQEHEAAMAYKASTSDNLAWFLTDPVDAEQSDAAHWAVLNA